MDLLEQKLAMLMMIEMMGLEYRYRIQMRQGVVGARDGNLEEKHDTLQQALLSEYTHE